MIIEKDGKLCNCGKFGCFEKYASMKAFKDNLRKKLGYDEKTSGKDLLNIIREANKYKENKNLEKNIEINYEKNSKKQENELDKQENKPKRTKEDERVKQIEQVIEEYIDYLNIGLTNLINIFEPEGIGIGGSFIYFEEILLQRLKNKILEPGNLFNERKNIEIETAILGNDSGIIGSVLTN